MSASKTPILIVNADDFGWNANATDRTVECFQAAQITSATALVYMQDSPRAAELALGEGIPTGLHLNLTDPFAIPSAPERQRDRHLVACRYFSDGNLRRRSWIYDPRIRAEVEGTIEDQLERFRQLYGREPTHVDGHNHVQVCPNVARSKALRGFKMRNALWAWPTKRTAMGVARTVRRLLTASGHLTSRYFIDIAELQRAGGEELRRQLSQSLTTSVEVMAHPGFDHELEALRSSAWKQAIDDLPCGTYRDLG